MGRLFDAAAALVGLSPTASYEGQAAMELEALADTTGAMGIGARLRFDVSAGWPLVIASAPVLRGMVERLRAGVPREQLAAAFHDAVTQVSLDVCVAVGRERGISDVALSGGVFQNARLLLATSSALEGAGFRVLTHQRVPPNDGGLALGQAAIATLSRATGAIARDP
jgi:hydrogenase maturation protein HypF